MKKKAIMWTSSSVAHNAMRKRKYGHMQPQDRQDDCLIEDIERYYQSKQVPEQEERSVANIHNLVGTANIRTSHTPLNLQVISSIIPNNTYDKQKFAAITIRLSDPVCTCLLFTSGRMVLTGCRTFIDCVFASHEIVAFLRRHIPSCSFELESINIQNIVGNTDLNLKEGEMIDLDLMHREKSIFCTYQRQMFPGLILRPNNCPVVLLIFLSGKIVITGGKTSQDITLGWQMLEPFVRSFVRPVVGAG